MLAFCQTVEIIVCGIVFRHAVIAPMVTANLFYRFHTCGTLVHHLHEVIVAVGGDGYAHFYLVSTT